MINIYHRKKKIKPNIIINYDSGFDSFKSPVLTNDSVNILGPKDILKKIDYVETESITLNNVNSDISINLKILQPEFGNLYLDINSLKFNLDVDQYTEEVISVPVNVLSSTGIKFNFYPKELDVKYFISIEDYKKTTPMDFRIDCFFDENQNFLIPQLTKKPDFIKNTRLGSSQIQLIILE